ncbi:MAG: class I SAM-dependent methyltransferase [Pseudomonadales bacterium]|nr:class I SAM-dependent methyltransferase [Pseudomonadales bacterium]
MRNILNNYRKYRRQRAELPSQQELVPVMTKWFSSELGQTLYAAEKNQLDPLLARSFGYHILQISCSAEIDLIAESPAGHKLKFAPKYIPGQKQAVALAEALPLESDSVDTVVLHHALDFTPDKHRLLREATRVIIPGGKLLIVGFNPFSLWGGAKLIRWHRAPPWNARFVPGSRVSDWLELLEFRVDQITHGGYLLPLNYRRLLRYADFLERTGQRMSNPLGAFYVITAYKERVPITPVVRRWPRLAAPVLGRPGIEPAGLRHHQVADGKVKGKPVQ